MKYKMLKLSDIGNIITGNTPPKKNKEYYLNGVVPFVKPNNFNTSTISILSEADEKLSLSGAKAGRMVEAGTVLVTCIGTIGSVGIASRNICFNQQINAIEPNPDIINNRYLAYAITKRRAELKAIANAPVVPIINKTQFSAFEIPVPSLETQKKIVEVLDKAQELIDARKEQIMLMNELIRSVFYEMFGDPVTNPKGWDIDELNNHLDVIGGYAFKSSLFAESGIPVLKIGNINAGYFRPTNLRYWDEDKKLTRYEISAGDVVMSLTGTVGKDDYGNVCIMGDYYPKYYLNQRNAKLNLYDSLDKFYLTNALKVPEIKKKLTGISRGVRQANISNKDIQKLELPIPSIEIQRRFAKFVQQSDQIKVCIQTSLDEIQILFDSLIQGYFE